MSGYASAAAAAAAGGGLVQGAMNILGQGIQYVYNRKLAEQQNEFNIDMWRMNNEYNSPSAQMQRFKEAGLNPNLIYGQGSAGNSSSPPQLVVPEPVRIDKTAETLGKLFNLVNLKNAAAEADLHQQQADSIFIDNQNKRDERAFMHDFSELWSFDPSKGEFVFTPPGTKNNVTTAKDPSRLMRHTKERSGAYNTRNYRFYNRQYEYYKGLQPFTLYPSLINLRNQQSNYLAPQIKMKNYDWDHYHETFYIDRANKGIVGAGYGLWNALKNFIGF